MWKQWVYSCNYWGVWECYIVLLCAPGDGEVLNHSYHQGKVSLSLQNLETLTKGAVSRQGEQQEQSGPEAVAEQPIITLNQEDNGATPPRPPAPPLGGPLCSPRGCPRNWSGGHLKCCYGQYTLGPEDHSCPKGCSKVHWASPAYPKTTLQEPKFKA